MTAAGIYCRISKDDAGTALGVARQERLCRQLAAERDLEVVEVFTDNDISAYNGKRRPGLTALLEAVEAGRVHAVIVYHVDRLYRRAVELEALVALIERTGAEVLTVAAGELDLHTASGQMVARILSSVAQGEAGRMSERLRAKSDDLARAGKPPGGRAPYGYGAGYTVYEPEARWVRHAAGRILEGWSLLRAARELDQLGVPTRQGKPWHHSTLRNILVSPAVAGLRVHRREIAGPAEWTPILDRQTWERLRAVLAVPNRRKHRSGGPYLLSGLVRTEAGDHVNGRIAQGRARHYATPSGSAVSVQIDGDRLEAAIVEAVLLRFDDAKLPEPDPTASPADLEQVEAEMAELADLRGRGVISLAEWLAAREPLQQRLTAARAAIAPASPMPALGPSLRAAWPALTVDQRQAVLRSVIGRVVVRPVGRSKSVPIRDRVDLDWKA